MTNTILTNEFVQALQTWMRTGNRAVNIELRSAFVGTNECVSVWCYDRDLTCGMFVTNIHEIPTTEQLKEKRKQDCLLQLERLNDV